MHVVILVFFLGGGRQPSFTNISRKSDAATPIPEKQPFQRERSFVETNFVQTPRTTNVTQIVAEKVIATPGLASLTFFHKRKIESDFKYFISSKITNTLHLESSFGVWGCYLLSN